jgi:hypothetical protein
MQSVLFFEGVFYEKNRKANNHKNELEEDGIKVLRGTELADIKDKIKGSSGKLTNLHENIKYAGRLTVFPRRAVLRVGLILRDSKVAVNVH